MKSREKLLQEAAAFDRVFSSPDGKIVLEALEREFGGSTLKKVNGLIDPHACVAAGGCREVLLYIQLKVKQNAVAERSS